MKPKQRPAEDRHHSEAIDSFPPKPSNPQASAGTQQDAYLTKKAFLRFVVYFIAPLAVLYTVVVYLDLKKSIQAAQQQVVEAGQILEATNRKIAMAEAKLLELEATREGGATAFNLYAAPGSEGQNIFLGVNAGNRSMDAKAIYNTAVGRNALASNKSGQRNSAVGHNALHANTSGYHNTAIGSNVLGSNTTGRDNTAMGLTAMYKNISGFHNSAFGVQSLWSNTTGSNNASFGRDANFSNTTGNWNAGFGVDAIPGVTTGNGNSAFGGESGYTEDLRNQNVTGSYNSWFGYQSGPASPRQVSNSIAIGYRAKNTKNNQAVLGNPKIEETVLHGTVLTSKLCVGDVCLTAERLEQVLANL